MFCHWYPPATNADLQVVRHVVCWLHHSALLSYVVPTAAALFGTTHATREKSSRSSFLGGITNATLLLHNHVGAGHGFSRSRISGKMRITRIARWKIVIEILFQTNPGALQVRVILMIVVACRCACEVVTVIKNMNTSSMPALRLSE